MGARLGGRISGAEDDLVEAHEINVTPFIDVMLVLLIIFMVARGIDYRACPSCMRKKIATAAGIQIFTAHVVFPIVLIFHIIQFCRTFVPGHSD